MKNVFAVGLFLLTSMACWVGFVPAQSVSYNLKSAITNDQNIKASRQAIRSAVQEHNANVLVEAIVDPNWGRKSEALLALDQFTLQEKRGAYVAILNDSTLWKRVKGGRGLGIQEDFGRTMKTVLSKASGNDFSEINLFDDTARQNIVMILLKK